MQNEEIMMRPGKKKMGEEEKGPCQRELSHCVSTDLVPERHCGTTQHVRASGLHTEGSGGHPALQPPRSFPPRSLSPYFLCKLQESLIMLYPGFNERLPLPRPSALFIYLSMGKQLRRDKCDFDYMVVCGNKRSAGDLSCSRGAAR